MPRWKEELVCTGPGGTFIIEAPMGTFSVCLPTEETWKSKCPPWAADLWPKLREELELWCRENNAKFYIEDYAWVAIPKTDEP